MQATDFSTTSTTTNTEKKRLCKIACFSVYFLRMFLFLSFSISLLRCIWLLLMVFIFVLFALKWPNHQPHIIVSIHLTLHEFLMWNDKNFSLTRQFFISLDVFSFIQDTQTFSGRVNHGCDNIVEKAITLMIVFVDVSFIFIYFFLFLLILHFCVVKLMTHLN